MDLLLVHSLAAWLRVTLSIIVVHNRSIEPRWQVEPVWSTCSPIVWQSRVVTHDMGSNSLEQKRISKRGEDLTTQHHISRHNKDELNVLEER